MSFNFKLSISKSLNVASEDFHIEDNVVIILPDTGERYLSTDLFAS